MKLLILTQKIDSSDPILGFFVRWALEFAKHCESIVLICLYEGEHNLPDNVRVLSLGKEEGVSRLTYLIRFYKYIYQERKNYDSVFVHMNQIYIILGGLFWRLWSKKISLWYAHGGVSMSLKIAVLFTHNIFTSTKSGFRLETNKTKIVGQGIDIDLFNLKNKSNNERFEIVSIGRISPVKDYETLIEAVKILSEENINVTIIGDAGLGEQEKYLSNLKKMVVNKSLENRVHFIGGMPNNDIVKYLQRSDLFVNTSHTGSLDKAILEAMSTGTPVLTCNEAVLGVLGGYKDILMFPKKSPKRLAEKIKNIVNMENKKELGKSLRNIVVENHSLNNFVKKIMQYV